MLGVLTHGELDNGRGLARMKLFRHKHEMESGRTSSVGNDILGFSAGGEVVNKPDHGHLDWIKICEQAAKVSIIHFTQYRRHRYLKVFSYIKEYNLNKFYIFLCISTPVISNYRYLKVHFLVLWDQKMYFEISVV